MDEQRFWSLIESAWEIVGRDDEKRQALPEGAMSEDEAEEVVETLEEVIPVLQDLLDELPPEELLAFDRILEKKLFDIDRAEIQEHTDGSNDGFLYARGFIVAAGKKYYDAVNNNPAVALMDLECQAMCYLSWHLYHEKFGEVPKSDISRDVFKRRRLAGRRLVVL